MLERNHHSHDRHKLRGAIAAIAAGGVIALGSYIAIQNASSFIEMINPSEKVDLLKDASWTMPGATYQNNQLRIKHIDTSIAQLNSNERTANPPVNLFGTHLEHDGDFALNLSVSDIQGEGHFTLYGTPPIIEDEFRAEQGMLDIEFDGTSLFVHVSDSEKGRDAIREEYSMSRADSFRLGLAMNGNSLKITIDDKDQAESISVGTIFTGKNIWFGANTTGAYNVHSLTATSKNGSTIAQSHSLPDLKQKNNSLADQMKSRRQDFDFGAAIAAGPIVSDPKYREILGEYDSISTENIAKWQFIHPEKDVYNFSDMDAIVALATAGHYKIHGHALIFSEANPKWIQDLRGDKTALEQAAISHIQTVVGRYKGKVSSWDVINEPLADYGTESGISGLRKNIWYETLGENYIETMLRTAHAADPNAKLWINDFGMESDDARFETMLRLATTLKQKGVPLDGIGFQSHIDTHDTNTADENIDESKLHDRIRRLDAVGLKTRFSELDISNETEYQIPSQFIRACLGEKACVGVTTWGITDRYSSGGDIDNRGRYSANTGLLWDASYQETSALRALRDSLK